MAIGEKGAIKHAVIIAKINVMKKMGTVYKDAKMDHMVGFVISHVQLTA